MIIEPKVRGFICTTAHPSGLAEGVRLEAQYCSERPFETRFKKVLVLGASMGYGLASRIALCFGGGADTVGVIFDRPATAGRTASAGWYNTAAFEKLAEKAGRKAVTINGDAYSAEIKTQTIDAIKKNLGKVDLVVYSLASPRRTLTDGTVYNSVLKTLGEPYSNKTVDLRTNELTNVTVTPANEAETLATVKVMGGEDWKDWIVELKKANVLSDNAETVAYSYIGPKLTHPMYLNGTIGKAKEHLYATAKNLTLLGVGATVAVNKALVTQSSSAIPVVPLYIAVLYKIMKKAGSHEGCIEQMYRLFAQKFDVRDDEGLIRMDDYEMDKSVQNEVVKVWEKLNEDNFAALSDIDGYWEDFYKLFGFKFDGIDYSKDVNEEVKIKSVEAK